VNDMTKRRKLAAVVATDAVLPAVEEGPSPPVVTAAAAESGLPPSVGGGDSLFSTHLERQLEALLDEQWRRPAAPAGGWPPGSTDDGYDSEVGLPDRAALAQPSLRAWVDTGADDEPTATEWSGAAAEDRVTQLPTPPEWVDPTVPPPPPQLAGSVTGGPPPQWIRRRALPPSVQAQYLGDSVSTSGLATYHAEQYAQPDSSVEACPLALRQELRRHRQPLPGAPFVCCECGRGPLHEVHLDLGWCQCQPAATDGTASSRGLRRQLCLDCAVLCFVRVLLPPVVVAHSVELPPLVVEIGLDGQLDYHVVARHTCARCHDGFDLVYRQKPLPIPRALKSQRRPHAARLDGDLTTDSDASSEDEEPDEVAVVPPPSGQSVTDGRQQQPLPPNALPECGLSGALEWATAHYAPFWRAAAPIPQTWVWRVLHRHKVPTAVSKFLQSVMESFDCFYRRRLRSWCALLEWRRLAPSERCTRRVHICRSPSCQRVNVVTPQPTVEVGSVPYFAALVQCVDCHHWSCHCGVHFGQRVSLRDHLEHSQHVPLRVDRLGLGGEWAPAWSARGPAQQRALADLLDWRLHDWAQAECPRCLLGRASLSPTDSLVRCDRCGGEFCFLCSGAVVASLVDYRECRRRQTEEQRYTLPFGHVAKLFYKPLVYRAESHHLRLNNRTPKQRAQLNGFLTSLPSPLRPCVRHVQSIPFYELRWPAATRGVAQPPLPPPVEGVVATATVEPPTGDPDGWLWHFLRWRILQKMHVLRQQWGGEAFDGAWRHTRQLQWVPWLSALQPAASAPSS
jgi:hypothetical protein